MTTAPNPTTSASRAPWRAWLLIVAALLATFTPGLSAASASATHPTSLRACAWPKTALPGSVSETTPERVPRASISHGTASGSEAAAEESAGGVSVYLYAHANPVNGIDPSGNFTLSELNVSTGVMGVLARAALPSVTRFLAWNYGTVATSILTAQVVSQTAMAYITYYVTPTALALENFGVSQHKRQNHPLAIRMFGLANKGYALTQGSINRAGYAPVRAALLGKMGLVFTLFKAGAGMVDLIEYKAEIYNALAVVSDVSEQISLENISADGARRLAMDTMLFSSSPWEFVELAQEAFEAKQDNDHARALGAVAMIRARMSRYQ